MKEKSKDKKPEKEKEITGNENSEKDLEIKIQNAEDKISHEIDNLKKEIENYKDLFLRKAAEFDNYKKRTDKEIISYIKYSSESILKKLIPVFDDLSRSIDSINKGETNDFDILSKGVTMIYEKFQKILSEEGVKEIDCLGKEFDVNLCDALLQVPKTGVKPNTVVEVVEKGYKYKDKVLKHAKVIVSTQSQEINSEK
jgi:molecular chaperone GrpE